MGYGQNPTGIEPSMAMAKEMQPLELAVERAQQAYGVLVEAVEELERRLQPVLGMERPEAAEKPYDEPAGAPLTNAISQNANGVFSAAGRLRSLLARLEV